MKFSVNFKFPYITHKAIWLPNESDVISTLKWVMQQRFSVLRRVRIHSALCRPIGGWLEAVHVG